MAKKQSKDHEKFGNAVRAMREGKFSQEAFADLVGIDRSYMGGVERGERNLALTNILKIIDGLGMQPSEFFAALDRTARRGKTSSAK